MRPLILALSVLLLAVAGWLLWQHGGFGGRPVVDPGAGEAVPAAVDPAAPPPTGEATRASPGAAEAPAAPEAPPAQGLLRARIRNVAGASLPQDWTLRVLPQPPHWSDFDPEAELRAMEEEDEAEGDSQVGDAGGDEEEDEEEDEDEEEEVDDEPALPPPSEHRVTGSAVIELPLPLGRYRVLAQSAYARSAGVAVHLAKDAPNQEVTLDVAPMAIVLGKVRTSSGDVAGLPVFVEEVASGERFEVTASDTGDFRVEGVAAGPARLAIGSWRRPLVPRREVRIQAPLTEIPVIDLPSIGSLEVLVLGPDRQAVTGAKVSVVGMGGGAFTGFTGEDGRVSCRFLGEGPARVVASHQSHRANARVVILPSRAAEVTLTLSVVPR